MRSSSTLPASLRRLGGAHRLLVFAAAAALIAPTAGCRRIKQRLAEKAIEESTGGKVDFDDDGRKVTLKGDKPGQNVALGSSTKLPVDFPSNVPLYPGATIVTSATLTNQNTQGGKGFSLSLSTADTPEQVVQFYRTKSPATAKKTEMNSQGGHVFTYEDGGQQVMVVASSGGDRKTNVQLTVMTKAS